MSSEYLNTSFPSSDNRNKQHTTAASCYVTTTSDAFGTYNGDAVSRRQHDNSFHFITWNSNNRECFNNSKNGHFELSFRCLLYSIHSSRTSAWCQVNVNRISLFARQFYANCITVSKYCRYLVWPIDHAKTFKFNMRTFLKYYIYKKNNFSWWPFLCDTES